MGKKCVNENCPYNVEEYCEAADECAVFEPEKERICATCRSYTLYGRICLHANRANGTMAKKPTDTCMYWEERDE